MAVRRLTLLCQGEQSSNRIEPRNGTPIPDCDGGVVLRRNVCGTGQTKVYPQLRKSKKIMPPGESDGTMYSPIIVLHQAADKASLS
jgi:hypothetical protein